jgi:hypothetical protein
VIKFTSFYQLKLLKPRLGAVDCSLLSKKKSLLEWILGFLKSYILQIYLTKIFVLPKKIIKTIEQKFARIGRCSKSKSGFRVCVFQKRDGGLEIKKIMKSCSHKYNEVDIHGVYLHKLAFE